MANSPWQRIENNAIFKVPHRKKRKPPSSSKSNRNFRLCLRAFAVQVEPYEVYPMKIRAENAEPGQVVITSQGRSYKIKSFWMDYGVVTLFGDDGSETDYDYDEVIEVANDAGA